MLGGCDSGDHDLKAQLDLLQSETDRLDAENKELREENGKLLSAKESADEQLDLLKKENAELEKTLAGNENKKPAYSPVTLHKSEYTLQYLGNEKGENGECILVMRCQGFYDYPYIRINTKDFELHMGIYVVEGSYEFANENIDENGYLYLINDATMADSYAKEFPEMKLTFVPEKYIKLRAKEPELQYDDVDDGDRTSFIGHFTSGVVAINGDGSIDDRYLSDRHLDIMCYADFMRFDEESYDYDLTGMGR